MIKSINYDNRFWNDFSQNHHFVLFLFGRSDHFPLRVKNFSKSNFFVIFIKPLVSFTIWIVVFSETIFQAIFEHALKSLSWFKVINTETLFFISTMKANGYLAIGVNPFTKAFYKMVFKLSLISKRVFKSIFCPYFQLPTVKLFIFCKIIFIKLFAKSLPNTFLKMTLKVSIWWEKIFSKPMKLILTKVSFILNNIFFPFFPKSI